MANLAYVRVSTLEQNESRQLEALKKYNIDEEHGWFIEKVSGKNTTDRPELQALMKHARKNDTIYIESFSRLARNTSDLLNLTEQMTAKGIKIISLKEGLDSSTPTGKLMLTMIGAIATFERENLLERQREGIAIAKAQGKYKGRSPKKLPDNFNELYKQYMTRAITKSKLAELCSVSRPILDRLIKEHELTAK